MPQSRTQCQEGFSLSDFIQAFGTEDKCYAALETASWPNGFRCPQCGVAESFDGPFTSRWIGLVDLQAKPSDWTKKRVAPGSAVFLMAWRASGPLRRRAASTSPKSWGWGRKPKDMPIFQWLNTIIVNVKTGMSGTYHASDFQKYGNRFLSEVAYRFNCRFNLKGLPKRLLIACLNCTPQPEQLLRSAELCC